ncbi:MAG: MarR family transcriptional regulator [Microscillaceae bacterium]|nr:MarR family transcriptional regulator [Microscillaceae bacterium]
MQKIEDKLAQKKFQNEWHKLRVNLLHTASWLKNEVADFLAPYGITQPQFNILRIVRGHHPEPLSTLQIRERMIDRMSDTSRMVERLVKKSLLRKEPCTHDKRLVNIYITEAGLSLLFLIDQKMPQLDAVTQGLDEAEAQLLNALLDKLRVEGEVPFG